MIYHVSCHLLTYEIAFFRVMGAHKTFLIKRKYARAQKSNRPLPQWVRMKTGNKIRYNAKLLSCFQPIQYVCHQNRQVHSTLLIIQVTLWLSF
uniref:Ribosomal protein L39 n=1 Tax=Panagrolaimus sp. JU765 TaxID=591449 RepID=A0AC34QDM1_9BILA